MEASSEKAKYWHNLIRDWRASGQPKKKFAQSRGVSADAMSYWVTKFNKGGRPNQTAPAFVPVNVVEKTCEDQTITIHLSNGLSMTFAPGTPTAKICALASALSATYA